MLFQNICRHYAHFICKAQFLLEISVIYCTKSLFLLRNRRQILLLTLSQFKQIGELLFPLKSSEDTRFSVYCRVGRT